MAVTKENQSLHSEITQVVSDREHCKEELVECERRIQYIEDVLRSKEQEKDHLMSSYRKLISEYEKLDLVTKGSSEESNNMR